MLNRRQPTIGVILRICVPLALMLGAVAVARSDDDSISAKLKKDQDVGVAFNDIPQGFFDVIVSLVHPDDWSIVTNDQSSRVVSKSGDTIWDRTSADEETHIWEGCGVTEDCWPGVLFAGNLTKHTSGGPGGGGEPPGFNASVADIDIDVDSLGLHSDEPTSHHWPPDGSYDEDQAEDTETGGLYLPASLVTGQFPSNLPSGTDYKILKLTLNPKWVGTPSYDGNVGTLTFSTTGQGFALYELTGEDSGALVSSIRVPPNGFTGKQYAILTNEDFTDAGGITATFTWDSNLKGGEDTATDYVRIAPIEVHFVRETEPESGDFVVVDSYGLPTFLPTDGVGSGDVSLAMCAPGLTRFVMRLSQDLSAQTIDTVAVSVENAAGTFDGELTETAANSGVFTDPNNTFTLTTTPTVTSDTTHDVLSATVTNAALGLTNAPFTLVEGPPGTVDSLDFCNPDTRVAIWLSAALDPDVPDTITLEMSTSLDSRIVQATLTETAADSKVFKNDDETITLTMVNYSPPDPDAVDTLAVHVVNSLLSITDVTLSLNETHNDSLVFDSEADTSGAWPPSVDITPSTPATNGQGVFYIEVTGPAAGTSLPVQLTTTVDSKTLEASRVSGNLFRTGMVVLVDEGSSVEYPGITTVQCAWGSAAPVATALFAMAATPPNNRAYLCRAIRTDDKADDKHLKFVENHVTKDLGYTAEREEAVTEEKFGKAADKHDLFYFLGHGAIEHGQGVPDGKFMAICFKKFGAWGLGGRKELEDQQFEPNDVGKYVKTQTYKLVFLNACWSASVTQGSKTQDFITKFNATSYVGWNSDTTPLVAFPVGAQFFSNLAGRTTTVQGAVQATQAMGKVAQTLTCVQGGTTVVSLK